MTSRLLLPTLVALVLSGCSTVNNTSVDSKPYVYGTKSVYQPQESEADYHPAPQGYQLVYTELLARHGSRGLSKPKYDYISMQIWQKAKQEHALTPLGETLGADIARFTTANKVLGYGNLTKRGENEHKMMGERMATRDRALFRHAVEHNQPIVMEYSGKQRAKDSGLAFVTGMEKENTSIASLVSKPIKNKNELYFHKQPQNAYYQDYKKHNPQLRATVSQLMNLPKTHAMAQQMLERVYKPAFVDQLTAGKLSFYKKGATTPTTYNDVDAAIQLYNLYLAAPGMSYEAGKTPWDFKRYVTPDESQWFTYILDGKDFYEKGPSFAGTDITYRMATVLENDFFKEIQGIKDGSNHKAAKIRFAHAETIMPFAALMKLPGSTKSQLKGELYTRQNNPWRGAWVAPYSANIQWDVYQNQTGTLLVKALYNEKEIHFKNSCHPMSANSYFYTFSELKRCYGE